MSQGQSTVLAGGSDSSAALDVLGRCGDHYSLLNVAMRQLDLHGDNDDVILLACRSHIALGLVGPARELLERVTPEMFERPEIRRLAEEIDQAPSGRVAWGSLQDRFEKNLASVYARYPELREHDAAFRLVPKKFELFRSVDENHHLATRVTNGHRRWVPDLCDVRRLLAGADLPHDSTALLCAPYLVAGDRFGMLFDRVFAATKEMFLTFTPRIYFLEVDAAAFGAALYVMDSADRLCHDRVHLFVGPDCVQKLTDHFEQHDDQCTPKYAVRLTDAGQDLCNQALGALQPKTVAMDSRAQSTLNAVRRHYDALPSDHWNKRFRPDRDEPLRVLGLTSRFTTYLQYSMRDWGAAFESRGHEFRVLLESNDHDLLRPIRTAEVIDEFKPDLVVIIDHLRREYGAVIPANLPLVCWIQDLLPNLTTAEAGPSLGPLDFFIAPDPSAFGHRYNYPTEQGIARTMATDDRVYSHEPLAERELRPYRCDLSYVSSHSTPPEQFHMERKKSFAADPTALRLTDALYDALVQSFADKPRTACSSVLHVYQAVKSNTQLTLASTEMDESLRNNYLLPLAELLFRQTTLEWIADFCDRTGKTLLLYGNGWEKHPRFARYARGFAKNGPELRAIYQASTINLQAVASGSVHQRLLDGLAAGGFFLIRYTPADMMHQPAQRFLEAYRDHRPRMATEYTADEMPEVARAIECEWRLRGLDRTCDRFRLTTLGVRHYEEMENTEYRRAAGAVFPEYERVSFASREECEQLITRFLADPRERRHVGRSMRSAIVDRYSYGALVDEVLQFIAGRLVDSPRSPMDTNTVARQAG